MLKERKKWRADRGSRAARQLSQIQQSIGALANDDLLDLADIFIDTPQSPIAELAAAEMKHRKISL